MDMPSASQLRRDLSRLLRQAAVERLPPEAVRDQVASLIASAELDEDLARELEREAMQRYAWLRERSAPRQALEAAFRILQEAGRQYARARGRIQQRVAEAVEREMQRGGSRTEIEAAIRPLLRRLEHYRFTIANTAMAALDRIDFFEKARAAGVQRFRYVGPPPIRDFCKQHWRKTYTYDQILKLDNGQGLPVWIYGGGWNCRHRWVAADDLVAQADAAGDLVADLVAIARDYDRKLQDLKQRFDLYAARSQAISDAYERETDSERRRKLLRLAQKLDGQAALIQSRLSVLRTEAKRAIHDAALLRERKSLRLNYRAEGLSAGERNTILWLERLVGRDMPAEVVIESERVGRAHYVFEQHIIRLSYSREGRTLVHEFGHALDDLFPEIHEASLRWILERAAGEKPGAFRDLWAAKVAAGRLPADPHAAVKDRLPDDWEYVGKLYSDAAGRYNGTEVTSMGLEHFFADPIGLWRSFPDLFEHVITIIQMLR